MNSIYKNNKKILVCLSFVSIISLGFFMQGCSSDEKNEINPINQYCDFQNPYDYAGKYHNEGLMYVLSKMENPIRLKSSVDEIERNVYDLTMEFCKINPLNSHAFSEGLVASAIQQTKDIRLKSGDNNFSQTQLRYHKKFEDILANTWYCSSVSDVINKIRIVEKEIYESDMTDTDKEALLITYSVGRNSLEFWIGINNTIDTPRLKSSTEDTFRNWWNKNVTPAVEAIVKSDFEGAAAGALAGLVSGATVGTVVGLGVASVPTGITGAVTGAVTGGAGGAVYGSAIGGAAYFFSY